MSSQRSRLELALLIATGSSGVALTGLLVWVVLKYGQPQQLLLLVLTPFLALAFLSTWALWWRKRTGAWGCFVFFALQTVTIERDGSAWWPGYNFGVLIEVHRSANFEVHFGISSLVFALLAVGVIRQYWEERVIAGAPRVEPLLAPNTWLERKRGR
jgi:hypothetical protein